MGTPFSVCALGSRQRARKQGGGGGGGLSITDPQSIHRFRREWLPPVREFGAVIVFYLLRTHRLSVSLEVGRSGALPCQLKHVRALLFRSHSLAEPAHRDMKMQEYIISATLDTWHIGAMWPGEPRFWLKPQHAIWAAETCQAKGSV
ncbi:hypothetical protein I7I51_07420 [Histoplasma capsulatum]|uniref:Uncharacterized protein n=1 Tax=Ajellomyces capsulatus TaxID=5037 RepID=A0A8A1LW53_AJECA|nr:hypothetical protein I7I51_07420 [Histoplasma capsulatum]